MQEEVKLDLNEIEKEIVRIKIKLETGDIDATKEEATQKYIAEMIKKYRKDPLSYRK